MIQSEVPVRSGTTAEWADSNAADGAAAPVLGAGEIGVDTDKGEVRIGDGSTAFASLPRLAPVKAKGTATLVAGTKAVTITGLVAGDIVSATVRTLGTVTAPKALVAVASTDTLTITSSDNTDTSVVNYVVYPAG